MKTNITANYYWSKVGLITEEHKLCLDKYAINTARRNCKHEVECYNKNNPCEIRGICKQAWVEVDGVRSGNIQIS